MDAKLLQTHFFYCRFAFATIMHAIKYYIFRFVIVRNFVRFEERKNGEIWSKINQKSIKWTDFHPILNEQVNKWWDRERAQPSFGIVHRSFDDCRCAASVADL